MAVPLLLLPSDIYIALMGNIINKPLRPDCGWLSDKNNNYIEQRYQLINQYLILIRTWCSLCPLRSVLSSERSNAVLVSSAWVVISLKEGLNNSASKKSCIYRYSLKVIWCRVKRNSSRLSLDESARSISPRCLRQVDQLCDQFEIYSSMNGGVSL